MSCYFWWKTYRYADWTDKNKTTKTTKTLQFKMNKQMQIFSFNPPINSVEEGKWILGVTSFECTDSVFNITDENNSFSITLPGHWETKSVEKTSDEPNKLLELRSLEIHVKELGKRGNQTRLGGYENKLSDFDTQKKQDTWRIKKSKIQRSRRFS